MIRVKLGDVANRLNIHVDQSTTDLEYYVGGEHIESSEFMIKSRGLIKGSTIGYQFQFGFRKDDILFMTKNPHLRKCSMVDFDGLCSIATFVICTKDSNILLQKYLLLEMQSDRFWDYCEAHKSGGVNYFITWGTLSNYEFILPSIEGQQSRIEKAWSAYELKQSYAQMIIATDELVKSRFIEMISQTGVREFPLSELGTVGTGNTPSKKNPEFWDGDYPWVAAQDMDDKYVYSTIDGLTEEGRKKAAIIPANSILYVCRGSIGKMSISKIECGYNQSICSFHSEQIDPEYVFHCLLSKENEIKHQGVGTSFNSISQSEFARIKIPVVCKEEQNRFIAIVEQADKSKFELKNSIDAIDKVIKSLINENI